MIRAANLFQRSGELVDWGICQRAIGNLLTDMADAGYEEAAWAREQARERYEQSLSALTALDVLELATTRDAMGLLLQSEGRLDEAVELHEKVIEVLAAPAANPGSQALCFTTELPGRGRAGWKMRSRLLTRHGGLKETGDLPGLANLDHNEAEVDLGLGRFADARALFATALAEKLKAVETLHDEEQRVRLEEQIYNTWSGVLYASVKDFLVDPGAR